MYQIKVLSEYFTMSKARRPQSKYEVYTNNNCIFIINNYIPNSGAAVTWHIQIDITINDIYNLYFSVVWCEN